MAKGKAPVIILFIFLLAVSALAAFCFMKLQEEKATNQQLTEQVSQLETKKRELDKQVTDLRAKMEDLQAQRDQQQAKLKELQSTLTSVQSELESEQKSKQDAFSQAESAKKELASLKTTKAGLEAELKTTKETLSGIQEKLTALEKSHAAAPSAPEELRAKAQDLQLEKIVVTPSEASGQKNAAPGQGKVLAVNKEYDFVVVNLGQKDNISVSDMLEVFRNSKKICELKVEEVKDTMSVATPVSKESIRQIKEDDMVIRKTG
ncbi:MAG: hypothetical protein A2Y00_00290 [Omnitrophica WOR_2 bacterium GWF2_43_52]|nr:MAG: hypothetical protein A2062_00450 [Omnitrophica WOR_2 bacterium GWA2_44_7]OGX13948.1 MAG: hypothetical protein A2Y01_07885 [Omnitrophica WOR_2 bacterium GWC2_44_8]OGX20905.1 MAG: hypothetical protein A2Y00_00290 [Omnitrophica WOR_2 bacterium GWF2_43_52]OGX57069.1 MAG: hypothetical protein A2460_09005 [Omnitrophica WOR_2 bacterium RIFOXYC2_FULL_43_9]HAH21079.1 hypothetical protein [Candidatus Omnitrophota bacterium]